MTTHSTPPIRWFDPEAGVTVLEPPGTEKGYWSGGHDVWFDPVAGRYVMFYRLRRPRAVREEDNRGYECRVAVSENGRQFTDVWSASKSSFNSRSIEKGTLARWPDGRWRMYVSYEDLDSGRWQIDLLEADDPAGFDPAARRPALLPKDLRVSHIKDPVLLFHQGKALLFANYVRDPARFAESTLRVSLSAGGEAEDVVYEILRPEPGAWDAYTCRLTSVLPGAETTVFFYDGGNCGDSVCEESSGYAVGDSPLAVPRKITADRPLHQGVRYIHAVRDPRPPAKGAGILFYYEYTRPDGAHELRVIAQPLSD